MLGVKFAAASDNSGFPTLGYMHVEWRVGNPRIVIRHRTQLGRFSKA